MQSYRPLERLRQETAQDELRETTTSKELGGRLTEEGANQRNQRAMGLSSHNVLSPAEKIHPEASNPNHGKAR